MVSRDQKQTFSHTDENFAKVIGITLSAAFTVCMENEIFEVCKVNGAAIVCTTNVGVPKGRTAVADIPACLGDEMIMDETSSIDIGWMKV